MTNGTGGTARAAALEQFAYYLELLEARITQLENTVKGTVVPSNVRSLEVLAASFRAPRTVVMLPGNPEPFQVHQYALAPRSRGQPRPETVLAKFREMIEASTAYIYAHTGALRCKYAPCCSAQTLVRIRDVDDYEKFAPAYSLCLACGEHHGGTTTRKVAPEEILDLKNIFVTLPNLNILYCVQQLNIKADAFAASGAKVSQPVFLGAQPQAEVRVQQVLDYVNSPEAAQAQARVDDADEAYDAQDEAPEAQAEAPEAPTSEDFVKTPAAGTLEIAQTAFSGTPVPIESAPALPSVSQAAPVDPGAMLAFLSHGAPLPPTAQAVVPEQGNMFDKLAALTRAVCASEILPTPPAAPIEAAPEAAKAPKKPRAPRKPKAPELPFQAPIESAPDALLPAIPGIGAGKVWEDPDENPDAVDDFVWVPPPPRAAINTVAPEYAPSPQELDIRRVLGDIPDTELAAQYEVIKKHPWPGEFDRDRVIGDLARSFAGRTD